VSVLRFAILPLLAAAAWFTILFLAQRSMMYPAPPAPPGPFRGRAEVVPLQLSVGVVEALFLAPAAGRGPAPLIIFTHGNGELADYWVEGFLEPRGWGWGVLLLEYPGYGRSAGRPSERSIFAAADAALAWARNDPRVDAARIVAYGRSLGGGAATYLAVERGLAGLILESSFTSVRPLAARSLVPGWLVRDPFDNLARLGRYRGPLLVLHGRDDGIIPASHGRALAAAVPGATFHEMPCGHNDCARAWPEIRVLLDRVAGSR